MEGTIASFRGSRRTRTMNHIIIRANAISSITKAKTLENKKVSWKTPSGKEILGKIVAPHGNSGAVRAIFEKGLPGQALGKKVQIE